jgi:hypothetical protein
MLNRVNNKVGPDRPERAQALVRAAWIGLERAWANEIGVPPAGSSARPDFQSLLPIQERHSGTPFCRQEQSSVRPSGKLVKIGE